MTASSLTRIAIVRRGAKVINLSLGRSITALDLQSVSDVPRWTDLERAGVVLVVAAGNSTLDIDVHRQFPASLAMRYSNIVTVMATDVGGGRGRALNASGAWEPFSNFGVKTVALAAPGSMILGVPSRNKVAVADGTSFAAPQVTAAVALLMAVHPEWDYRTVLRDLGETSTPVDDLRTLCRSGGIINLARACDYRP